MFFFCFCSVRVDKKALLIYDSLLLLSEFCSGYFQRLERWPELAEKCPEPTELIVINSGDAYNYSWSTRGFVAIFGELSYLWRVIEVLLFANTRQRVSAITSNIAMSTSELIHLPSAM